MDSKEAREPKEIKASRDSRDAKEHKNLKEKKKITSPDADEFLEKILKSDKIKQIADLIAEKAADKILKESKTLDVFRSNGNKKEKEVEKETSEKYKHVDEFVADEGLKKDKVPKIDAKAAMKKSPKFPDTDVRLNYKHFIADSVVNKESSSNIRHGPEKLDEARDSAEESNEKHDKKSDNKSKIRESGEIESGENKRLKKYRHHSDSEHRSGKNKLMKKRTVNDDESVESVESVTAKEREVADNSKEEPDKHSKVIKRNELEESSRIGQRASKSFNNNDTESDTSDSESNKVPTADAHTRDLPSRTMIKNENGKLYAFAPSEDYEDYHEKLSSLLKSVQDKTISKLEKQPNYEKT